MFHLDIKFLIPCLVLLLAGTESVIAQSAPSPSGQSPASKQSEGKTSESNSDAEPEVQLAPVVDIFSPAITDHDLDTGKERAWEYRTYRVAVWMCLDGSPLLNAIASQVVHETTLQSELIDPSGWDLQIGPCPAQFRYLFLERIQEAQNLESIAEYSALANYDKLVVVCLNQEFDSTRIRVREFDLQTQQWGPLVVRRSSQQHQLASTVIETIRSAFMPLAKVDRVTKQGPDSKVFLDVRATESSRRATMNADLQWDVEPIVNSPVSIQPDDRFLPVIRRTDRDGKLVRLEPIEFTFLTISNREGVMVECSIQSSQRAPLAGRTSKRAEKLALVIRPPTRPSKLILTSRDDPEHRLEGFEIWSRPPGATQDQPSELLGKTDWRGSIEIPPAEEGLRLIYVKRGSRALKKLPIIPGLYDELITTVPNDETSLYAEGIIGGLEKEILNLVIQRRVYEGDIENALSKKKLDEAKRIMKRYDTLETPRDLKTRMANAEVRLKNMTRDNRERKFITDRFDKLRKLVNQESGNSKLTALQKEIQKQSGLPGTS